jgi:hypothetical protein
MQHTVKTLMSLADSYADAECSDYLRGEASSLLYRENLLKALTEALAPQAGFNGLTEAETDATMSVMGLSEPKAAQPVPEPLSDEQIQEIYISEYNKGHHGRDFENLFARGIEQAHGIGGDK